MVQTALWATTYMVLINVITYLVFSHDKRAARAQVRRVSENTLLMWALLGGSPAMLFAQQTLRHKTRKEPFRTTLWLIIGCQLCAAAYFMLTA